MDFSGGPMIRSLCFHCKGLLPGQRTKIPQAAPCGKKQTERMNWFAAMGFRMHRPKI